MGTFDLTESFVDLVSQQDTRHPGLGLSKDLGKVNVPLTSFALSQGLKREGLTVLHISVDNGRLHPGLIEHINSLDNTDAYKGQSVSRIKKLVRHLPWPESLAHVGPVLPAVNEEQLPQYLRQVWPLLPRTRCGRANARTAPLEDRPDGKAPPAPPISLIGISLGLTLLRVSKAHKISDIKTLLEDYPKHIHKDIKRNYHPARRPSIRQAFTWFRLEVRDVVGYEVEEPQPVTIPLDKLPEPLRTQVLTYKERAQSGLKPGHEIRKVGKIKYNLDLGRRSEENITDYLRIICLAVGYIPSEKYGKTLDLKDLLRLSSRRIELDGVKFTERFNALVDHYREREQDRESKYKEQDYDSRAFEKFIEALCAMAAYNGLFKLRELFRQAYKARLDRETLERRKRQMKEVFDRDWMGRQISRLKQRFHQIADEGSFKSKPDGVLSQDARADLNLCLFYVALLLLRFFGVRQQCVRDCVVGENVIFDVGRRVMFKWTEEETKNGKGIIHRLSMKLHGDILGDLIDGAWTYQKKIYPHLSGGKHSDESAALKDRRRKAIGGQFVVKARTDGLCVPFLDAKDFFTWFSRQSLKYLDFEGRLEEAENPPHPHFYRGMFGDWLRHDKRCSKELTADMAGDTVRVFEKDYVYQPAMFDATDTWTLLAWEARNQREGTSVIKHDELSRLLELVESQAELIEQLQEQNKELRAQQQAA